MSDLNDAEREILLDPCACGHTLNDHGDLGGCWMCNDEGESETECWVTCEALMVERVGRIVTQRTAVAEARAARLAEVVARAEALAPVWEVWAEEHAVLAARGGGQYDKGVARAYTHAAHDLRAALASPASVPESSVAGSVSAEGGEVAPGATGEAAGQGGTIRDEILRAAINAVCDCDGWDAGHDGGCAAWPIVRLREGRPAPTWAGLFGIDPDFTGGLPVDEFLRQSRGEA